MRMRVAAALASGDRQDGDADAGTSRRRRASVRGASASAAPAQPRRSGQHARRPINAAPITGVDAARQPSIMLCPARRPRLLNSQAGSRRTSARKGRRCRPRAEQHAARRSAIAAGTSVRVLRQRQTCDIEQLDAVRAEAEHHGGRAGGRCDSLAPVNPSRQHDDQRQAARQAKPTVTSHRLRNTMNSSGGGSRPGIDRVQNALRLSHRFGFDRDPMPSGELDARSRRRGSCVRRVRSRCSGSMRRSLIDLAQSGVERPRKPGASSGRTFGRDDHQAAAAIRASSALMPITESLTCAPPSASRTRSEEPRWILTHRGRAHLRRLS